jgi:hypothetical protein
VTEADMTDAPPISDAEVGVPLPRTVVPDVPSATYLACRRHIDALLDEGDRLRPLLDGAATSTPAGAEALVAVADVYRELKERGVGITDQVIAARAQEREALDVVVETRDERTLDLFARWIDLILRCDAYSASGDLRVPQADPDVVAARRRFLRALTAAIEPV